MDNPVFEKFNYKILDLFDRLNWKLTRHVNRDTGTDPKTIWTFEKGSRAIELTMNPVNKFLRWKEGAKEGEGLDSLRSYLTQNMQQQENKFEKKFKKLLQECCCEPIYNEKDMDIPDPEPIKNTELPSDKLESGLAKRPVYKNKKSSGKKDEPSEKKDGRPTFEPSAKKQQKPVDDVEEEDDEEIEEKPKKKKNPLMKENFLYDDQHDKNSKHKELVSKGFTYHTTKNREHYYVNDKEKKIAKVMPNGKVVYENV